MNQFTFTPNQKVKPASPGACVSYGIVREVWLGSEETDGRMWAGKELVRVYWPQIGGSGRWPASDLAAAD